MFDLVSPATGLNWSLEADLCGSFCALTGLGSKLTIQRGCTRYWLPGIDLVSGLGHIKDFLLQEQQRR